VFYGKQTRPILYCYCRDAAQRERSGRPSKTVGDILSTCWGYDQTNREFYEIVKVRGAAVTLRQIATETVATGDMTARVIPLPGQFVDKELMRRAPGLLFHLV
jgi:hypothetical protein